MASWYGLITQANTGKHLLPISLIGWLWAGINIARSKRLDLGIVTFGLVLLASICERYYYGFTRGLRWGLTISCFLVAANFSLVVIFWWAVPHLYSYFTVLSMCFNNWLSSISILCSNNSSSDFISTLPQETNQQGFGSIEQESDVDEDILVVLCVHDGVLAMCWVQESNEGWESWFVFFFGGWCIIWFSAAVVVYWTRCWMQDSVSLFHLCSHELSFDHFVILKERKNYIHWWDDAMIYRERSDDGLRTWVQTTNVRVGMHQRRVKVEMCWCIFQFTIGFNGEQYNNKGAWTTMYRCWADVFNDVYVTPKMQSD